MGGREVLEHGETFAEVCANRCLDDFAVWLRHQSAHASELLHLIDVTACAGIAEEEHWVDVLRALCSTERSLCTREWIASIVLQCFQQHLLQIVSARLPEIEQGVVAFTRRDRTAVALLLNVVRLLLRFVEQVLFRRRNTEIRNCERQT